MLDKIDVSDSVPHMCHGIAVLLQWSQQYSLEEQQHTDHSGYKQITKYDSCQYFLLYGIRNALRN